VFTPKRLIDFDAIWVSDKLAACPENIIPEYTWLYGIADSQGSFELTNLRAVWAKAYAGVRPHYTLSDLGYCLQVFHNVGLLFIWEVDGKRYGHWTGSTKKGRLPAPTHKNRFQRFAPEVPQNKLFDYKIKAMAGGTQGTIQNGFAFGLPLPLVKDSLSLTKSQDTESEPPSPSEGERDRHEEKTTARPRNQKLALSGTEESAVHAAAKYAAAERTARQVRNGLGRPDVTGNSGNGVSSHSKEMGLRATDARRAAGHRGDDEGGD
jgi:hypothetical protein